MSEADTQLEKVLREFPAADLHEQTSEILDFIKLRITKVMPTFLDLPDTLVPAAVKDKLPGFVEECQTKFIVPTQNNLTGTDLCNFCNELNKKKGFGLKQGDLTLTKVFVVSLFAGTLQRVGQTSPTLLR